VEVCALTICTCPAGSQSILRCELATELHTTQELHDWPHLRESSLLMRASSSAEWLMTLTATGMPFQVPVFNTTAGV